MPRESSRGGHLRPSLSCDTFVSIPTRSLYNKRQCLKRGRECKRDCVDYICNAAPEEATRSTAASRAEPLESSWSLPPTAIYSAHLLRNHTVASDSITAAMRSLSALPTSLLVLLSTATTSLAKVPVPADDTPHELGINVINPVTCSRPSQNGDTIRMHYRGRLLSTGAEFDSSYKRNKPFAFQLGQHQVIDGWDQGLLDMCPGEARELTIPPELGYGDHGMGPIPAGATLVFDTEMVEIMGVTEEDVITHTPTQAATSSVAATSSAAETSSATEQTLGIATAPATKTEAAESTATATPTFVPDSEDRVLPDDDSSPKQMAENESGECRLLGPFALLVQAALGGVALLTLVWKRFRETPKRPWKVWFFDVSKQVLGSILLHALNLLMSTMGSTDLANQAAEAASKTVDAEGRKPNPCSFYLLNLGIDVRRHSPAQLSRKHQANIIFLQTTIGIPFLYVLLKALHLLALRTPLASPTESVKSGHYGSPPQFAWYLKQLLIYFIGLVGMKLFVWFLFAALPWLPWVGDWALRWTEGNEALQIAFVMFIFPVAMNAIQYWIIDSFIMDKKKDQGYQQVNTSEDGDSGEIRGDDDSSITEVEDESAHANAKIIGEANATPVPVGSGAGRGGSGRSSPRKDD